MSTDQRKPARKESRAAEASLNEALNDLERILEKQRPSADAASKSTTETPAGQQYDIPLLDDVVRPGDGVADRSAVGHESIAPPAPGSPEYEMACRQLVARIASEIEVIVQSRIEAALESATDEIRQQVKNHIEIMLPEILDEITQDRGRSDK